MMFTTERRKRCWFRTTIGWEHWFYIRNNAPLSTDTTRLDRKDENKTCGGNIFRAIWLAFEIERGEEKPLQCLACKWRPEASAIELSLQERPFVRWRVSGFLQPLSVPTYLQSGTLSPEDKAVRSIFLNLQNNNSYVMMTTNWSLSVAPKSQGWKPETKMCGHNRG